MEPANRLAKSHRGHGPLLRKREQRRNKGAVLKAVKGAVFDMFAARVGRIVIRLPRCCRESRNTLRYSALVLFSPRREGPSEIAQMLGQPPRTMAYGQHVDALQMDAINDPVQPFETKHKGPCSNIVRDRRGDPEAFPLSRAKATTVPTRTPDFGARDGCGR